VGGLASGGGAGIQDPFSRLGIQKGHDALGLSVLHAPVALGIARQGPQVARTIQQGDPLRQLGQGFSPHAGRRQMGDQGGWIGAQGVDPQVERRRGIAGLSKHLRLPWAAPVQQLLRQPEGQGVAQGQGGCGVLWQGQTPPGFGIGGEALP